MALVCKIELSQTAGITLTVINSDGNITQTAKFDGTTITHICQGQDATSTITQTSDSVTVACKNFTVNAESITCKSTKDTLHEATGTFTINSTDKASINSSADLDVSATTQLNMSAADFSIKAENTTMVTASTITINGDNQTNVMGGVVAVTAKTNANVKGSVVQLAAATSMVLDGGVVTTVKGQVTNIQGSLVKLG
jgi:hypothetical protein